MQAHEQSSTRREFREIGEPVDRVLDIDDESSKCNDLFSKDLTTKPTRSLNFSPRVKAEPVYTDLFQPSPLLVNSLCSEDTQQSSSSDGEDLSLFQEAAQNVANFAEDLFTRQSQELQQTIEHFSQSSQRHEEAIERISNNLEQLTRILRERGQRN